VLAAVEAKLGAGGESLREHMMPLFMSLVKERYIERAPPCDLPRPVHKVRG
jgi:hypothetical protein